MKKPLIFKAVTLFLISTISFYSCGNDDEPQEPTVDPNAIIEFTDPNFKAALLEHGKTIISIKGDIDIIDTNSDGEIQVKEALAYTKSIAVSGNNLSDLKGIEFFKNISKLDAGNNSLDKIDLSHNTELVVLSLYKNQLSKLDISKNINLTNLNVFENQLTQLDVSNNKKLNYLSAYNNLLEGYFNLANNNNLTYLSLSENRLNNLNLANGNNESLNTMGANSNPNLICIQIDTDFTPPINWKKDDIADYSDNCQ